MEEDESTTSTSLPRARGFRPDEISDISTLVRSVHDIAVETPGFWIRNAQIEVVDTEFMDPVGTVVVTTDESQDVEVTFHPYVRHYF